MQILRPKRAYVAAKLEDHEEAKEAMQLLQSIGFKVTHDWTSWLLKHGEVTDDALRCRAKLDELGASSCDVLVVLAREDRYFKGAYCELGIAIASGAMVFVIGHGMDDCIFIHHPSVILVDSLDNAVQELLRMAACQASQA